MKKIDVIIPNYNYGKFLEMCLMSVFLQRTNFKIRIIVSDDFSSDQSLGILARYKNIYETEFIQMDYFQNSENLGEIENTCFLLEKCKGDYIAYLDADDYWIDPYKLQKQFDFMENNPEYSMCFTGHLMYGETEDFVPHSEGNLWMGPPNEYDREEIGKPDFIAKVHNCISSSSRFFRNYPDLANRNFLKNFSYTDWPLNFELSLRGKIKYLDFPGYVYRIHGKSLSRSIDITSTNSEQEWRTKVIEIFEERKQNLQS